MLKRLGDKMAGHKNRKKIDALIKLSAISSRSKSIRRSLNVAKHSRSCGGKFLKTENKLLIALSSISHRTQNSLV